LPTTLETGRSAEAHLNSDLLFAIGSCQKRSQHLDFTLIDKSNPLRETMETHIEIAKTTDSIPLPVQDSQKTSKNACQALKPYKPLKIKEINLA
jgi:hypothetical protein